MKQTKAIVLVALLALSLVACGQPTAPEGPDVQAEKAQLEQLLTERDAQIEVLNGQLEELNHQIAELSGKLKEAQAALQTAQDTLAEADSAPEQPQLPKSGSQLQPEPPSPITESTASKAPTTTTNTDGSRSLTISFGSEIESGTMRSTQEEAERLLSYLREYAENVGLEWTASAKDGGFEPAIEVSSKDVEAGIRSRIDHLKDAGREIVYGELQKDDRNPDEWNIILYR